MGGGFTLILTPGWLEYSKGRGNHPPKSMTGCKKNQGHKKKNNKETYGEPHEDVKVNRFY